MPLVWAASDISNRGLPAAGAVGGSSVQPRAKMLATSDVPTVNGLMGSSSLQYVSRRNGRLCVGVAEQAVTVDEAETEPHDVPRRAAATAPEGAGPPTNPCLASYGCWACRTLFRPSPSGCCVFCPCGPAKCPSRQ